MGIPAERLSQRWTVTRRREGQAVIFPAAYRSGSLPYGEINTVVIVGHSC